MNKRNFLKCIGVALAAPSVLLAANEKSIISSAAKTSRRGGGATLSKRFYISGHNMYSIKLSEISRHLDAEENELFIDDMTVIQDVSVFNGKDRVHFRGCNFKISDKC